MGGVKNPLLLSVNKCVHKIFDSKIRRDHGKNSYEYRVGESRRR